MVAHDVATNPYAPENAVPQPFQCVEVDPYEAYRSAGSKDVSSSGFRDPSYGVLSNTGSSASESERPGGAKGKPVEAVASAVRGAVVLVEFGGEGVHERSRPNGAWHGRTLRTRARPLLPRLESRALAISTRTEGDRHRPEADPEALLGEGS